MGQSFANLYKNTISSLHDYAARNNGKCLSQKYYGTAHKYEWECCNGHIWTAKGNITNQSRWCKICSDKKNGEKRMLSQIEVEKFAKQRNFVFLSKYKGALHQYKWRCPNEHIFTASYSCVRNTLYGCRKCGRFIKEEQCRFIFESLTKEKFPSNWQIIGGMQLDGYCTKLHLAFEYNGEQHYRKCYFHKTQADFDRQKERDRLKSIWCAKKSIQKIDIPYTRAKKVQELEGFIINSLSTKGFKIKGSVNWNQFIYRPEIDILREMAHQRNGELLSKTFLGKSHRYLWKCNIHNYQWRTSAANIKRTWCRKCGNEKSRATRLKYTIKDMQKLAESKNGECLSNIYINCDTHLLWKCNLCNTEWSAIPYSVLNGTWCPCCSQKKLIPLLQENARKQRKCNINSVVKLRHAGLSYLQISEQLGCSQTTAWRGYQVHLNDKS